MTQIAFKEWAAICAAIDAGEQRIILRKGGVAEPGVVFRPEHEQFWLYPTFFHESRDDAFQDRAKPWIEMANTNRPAAGFVRLQTLATVTECRRIDSLDDAMSLQSLHFWSPKTIEDRFHYRTPGLYCFTIEIERHEPRLIPEIPKYGGCKSWVELEDFR